MDSDNETSLASSTSSYRQRVPRDARRKADMNEMDVDSDSEYPTHLDSNLRASKEYQTPIQQNEGPINKLPNEVLMLVFEIITNKPDLVSMLTVCRRWGNLLVDVLWYRPSLMNSKARKGIYEVMKKNRTETFWDYRNYIRRLNLSFVFDQVDDEFLSLFEDCPNLERLTLVNCSKLSTIPIVNILQGCKKLQSIDMTGVKNIEDDIFIALADNCPRLQGIYAPGCPKISNEAIIRVADSCRFLKRVKVTNNKNINDEGLMELTSKCKALIEVDVQECPNLTDLSLETLFTSLSQLRELRISQNENLSDHVLRNLPLHLTLERLRILDLSNSTRITDRLIERFIEAAPKLRNVVLSKCSNITDASLRSLATLGKNLHYIHLGHCSNITDFGVQYLVRSCYRLQYVDFACCSQLTNQTLFDLAELPKLKRIGLVKCSNINDAGIMGMVNRRGGNDSLERVHLSYCTGLSIYPIFRLLQSCPRLTHLSLTGIHDFLREDITRFCRPPPSDFNEHQKSLFCVFSGQGVKQLKEQLARICANAHGNMFGEDQFHMFGQAPQPPQFADLARQFEQNPQLLNMNEFFRLNLPQNNALDLANAAVLQGPRNERPFIINQFGNQLADPDRGMRLNFEMENAPQEAPRVRPRGVRFTDNQIMRNGQPVMAQGLPGIQPNLEGNADGIQIVNIDDVDDEMEDR